MIALDLAPEVSGEGKMWRFIGINSPNRAEWPKTLLACMNYNMTTVGFYDAMSKDQIDYILKQTEMSTIFCTTNHASNVLMMKENGQATMIRNLVVIGHEQGA